MISFFFFFFEGGERFDKAQYHRVFSSVAFSFLSPVSVIILFRMIFGSGIFIFLLLCGVYSLIGQPWQTVQAELEHCLLQLHVGRSCGHGQHGFFQHYNVLLKVTLSWHHRSTLTITSILVSSYSSLFGMRA